MLKAISNSGSGSGGGVTSLNTEVGDLTLTSAGASIVITRPTSTTINLEAGGSSGVSSFTGDGVVLSNSASTGAVTATLVADAKNTVLAGPASGSNATPTFRALVGADLPNPSATTLGGVESIAAVSHNFLTSISTSGVPAQAQPAFTDISGIATVAQGGTGLGTLTAHAVLLGEGTSNVAFAAIGTSGRLLIDQGAAADPSFNAMSSDATITNAGVLTIANNAITTVKINNAAVTYAKIQIESASTLLGNPTGSGAAPSEITLGSGLAFSGTTLTASGSGGTVTSVSGTANRITVSSPTTTPVIDIAATYVGQSSITTLGTIATGTWNGTVVTPTFGGTGLATLTAHAVLLGEGTSNVAFATIGTSGRLLIDQGAASDPSFNAMSGDATITNAGVLTLKNTGSAGTYGQVTTDAQGRVTAGATCDVAHGGTGDTSLTTYAVLCGGTTSTGAVQSIASVGSSGQVLTSNGAGALPTFQAGGNGAKRDIGVTFDGGGSALTAGKIIYLSNINYSGTINGVTMLADQAGSAVVDIWKVSYASAPPTISNTITASALPTLSSAQKSQNNTLTGWTTSIAAGDTMAFKLNSASTITFVNLTLQVTVT